MNDKIHERLSAYIDGALTDQERRDIELEISRSEEMRLELEALRAVSSAVKGLPKEKLPDGFMARLEARRTREDSKPAKTYFILPPAYRPLAFALSTAVVALVIWDKTLTQPDIVAPHVGWDSETVSVKSAAEAPPSIDVSGQLAALGQNAAGSAGVKPDSPAAANNFSATRTKKENYAKAGAPSTFGKHLNAPGKPLEIAEPDPVLSDVQVEALDRLAEAEDKKASFRARNEEERSAINERLYKGFEDEKKRMGITRIVDKDSPDSSPTASSGGELMALQASPEAARVDGGRATGAVRGAKAKRAAAPIVKALTLKSADALQAAWAAAGLSGEPPTINFPDQMAVFLAGPQGCGIVDIQNRKKFIVVLYKAEGFDDASTRVRAVTLSPKPIVVKLAE